MFNRKLLDIIINTLEIDESEFAITSMDIDIEELELYIDLL